jgi:uncharacterized protein
VLAYFDTSAIVPLLIGEPSSPLCANAWNDARIVMSSAVTYVEVHAALACAMRQGRIDATSHREALNLFAVLWEDVVHIPVDDAVIRHAALLSAPHALRGYDAVHCATALAAASDDFVALSGDRDLLQAWSALGIATINTAWLIAYRPADRRTSNARCSAV